MFESVRRRQISPWRIFVMKTRGSSNIEKRWTPEKPPLISVKEPSRPGGL